jgi:hypothetical protein
MIGGFFCAEEPLTYFHLTLELFGLPVGTEAETNTVAPHLAI